MFKQFCETRVHTLKGFFYGIRTFFNLGTIPRVPCVTFVLGTGTEVAKERFIHPQSLKISS